MNSEPIAVTLMVVDALETLGVCYFIGGSLSSSVYGVARSTMDADIVAALQPEHAAPLADALSGSFYLDEGTIREAIDKRYHFNVIHLDTMFKVDIFIPRGRPFDSVQLERRVPQVFSPETGRTAYLSSAEDTILSKLEWFQLGGNVSDRQWQDILGVIRVQAGHLDTAYLRKWATALLVDHLLDGVLAQAAQV